jgi:hypothetical protein
VELPDLINMHIPSGTNATGMQYLIRWYAMTTAGKEIEKEYTFHNFQGGWYLSLSSQWAHRVAVVQQGNLFEFYLWDELFQESQMMMSIYLLTGENREEQATVNNRFVLHRSDGAIYAASLEVASASCGITPDFLIKSFHLIRQDWKNGET